MALYFLDTSAVIKRFVRETGSAWVTVLTEPSAGNHCWLATLTRVEFVAAIYLRVRTGTLTMAQARRAVRVFRRELKSHFQRVAFNKAILNWAMRLPSVHPLRAYDAVQLAAALFLRAQNAALGSATPPFVCADRNLNRAAVAEGLSVDDPNLHP